MTSHRLTLFGLLLGLLLSSAHVFPQSQTGQFLYLSDQRVVTVELVDTTTAVVNYINLNSSFEVFQAYNLVFLDDQNGQYRGHVIEREGNPESPFVVSDLLKPGQFSGYTIRGDLDLKGSLSQVLLLIGGRILSLEALSPKDFELAAARIGELNLEAPDRKLALQRAGFTRGFGKLYFSGSDEAQPFEVYFTDMSVRAPVALAKPSPRLPSSENHLPDPVLVQVRAVVSRAGGLRDVRPAQETGEKLERIAVETVRNSWVFLPAIADNELAEAELLLNVVFLR